MLKKMSVTVVFILAVFLLASQAIVFAQDIMSVTGKVKDVGLEDNSLVLGLEDGDQVFYMDENTEIMMNGKVKQLKDISIGSVIEVQYNRSGDNNMVVKINIVS